MLLRSQHQHVRPPRLLRLRTRSCARSRADGRAAGAARTACSRLDATSVTCVPHAAWWCHAQFMIRVLGVCRLCYQPSFVVPFMKNLLPAVCQRLDAISDSRFKVRARPYNVTSALVYADCARWHASGGR